MNKTQKILILIIGIFISIHCYYSFTDEKREHVLNPLYWESPYTYFDNQHWVKYGDLELNAYKYDISIFHPNNRFGLTYNIDVQIRYKNDEVVKELLKKIQRAHYFEERDLLTKAQHIPKTDEKLRLEDYLVGLFLEGQEPYEKMMNIQFHTSLFPKKYLQFIDDNGDKLLINTNPLFFFRSFGMKVIFGIIIMIIWLSFTLGYADIAMFLLLPVLMFAFFSDYVFWFVLGFIFVSRFFMSMKIRHVEFLRILIPFYNYWKMIKYILILIFLGIFVYVYDWNKPFSFDLIFGKLFEASIRFIIGVTFIWSTFKGFYLLYFHFKYPKIKVHQIRLSSPQQVLSEIYLGPFPQYFCDVQVNRTIEVIYAKIHISIYWKLIDNDIRIPRSPVASILLDWKLIDTEVKITHYKTDGKGNYIFYKY